MRGDGDMPTRIAQGHVTGECERCPRDTSCPPCVYATTCPTCNGERQVLRVMSDGSRFIDPCPRCQPTEAELDAYLDAVAPSEPSRKQRIHPLASIGDPPEHRDYIAGTLEALDPGVELGRDVVISAFVTIDRGITAPTRIGDRTLLMAKVHVAHDCQIGSDVEIGASAVLCGHVTVGDGAQIHALASVRPFITIGAGARVGIGSVVVKDVPPGEVWAGNPARPLVRGRVAAERGQTDGTGARMTMEEFAERCSQTSSVDALGNVVPPWRRFS